ncbi:BREX system ATP-binding domain-containing protein [Mycolicibacterium sp. GCM10028919]|uniref:BREX system ATP-binding domain-containing protein n=1 Tax=Mycolicibacterium sp. GCM10028919 TaxID=3273401 RepID=UPI003619B51C
MIPIHPDDWSDVISADLPDFVGGGGALVRFVVGETPGAAARAKKSLRALASSAKLHFFEIDGSTTRLHFANDLLGAVAEQIDFHEVMTSFLLQTVVEEGYEVPDETKRLVVRDIAEYNRVDPMSVQKVVNARIRSAILQDRRLVRDVRYALFAIAREVLRGVTAEVASDVPRRWLQNEISSIRELRHYGIVQKVNRYNARGILRSILTWLPNSGWRGSILYIDATRLAEPRNLRDSTLYYTRAALSDAYEVMREFIDDTDDMSHVLLVYSMPPEFLSVEPRGRGMGAYQALQFRVNGFPEATHPNPLSNLVVLRDRAQRRSFSV